MTCERCGNRRKWVHRTVEFKMFFFDDAGDMTDSDSLDIEEITPVECGECYAPAPGLDGAA